MSKHRNGVRSRRERGSITLGCSAQISDRRSDVCPNVLRKPLVGGVHHEPKCLVKRQFEASKVTPRRPCIGPYRLQVSPTGNSRLMAAWARDEEEAKALGNSRDRDCHPTHAKELGPHISWCNASRRLQVIHHERVYVEPC